MLIWVDVISTGLGNEQTNYLPRSSEITGLMMGIKSLNNARRCSGRHIDTCKSAKKPTSVWRTIASGLADREGIIASAVLWAIIDPLLELHRLLDWSAAEGRHDCIRLLLVPIEFHRRGSRFCPFGS